MQRWQEFRAEAVQSGNGRALLQGRPPTLGTSVSWIRDEVEAVAKLQDTAASSEVVDPAEQQQQQGQGPDRLPSPTRSPSDSARRRSSRQQLHLPTSTASQYFDAEEGAAEEAEEGAGPLPQELPVEEVEEWAAASPRPHHARNISVDSVGLAPGADVPAHKASEPL